ncbi:hypothetical protein, partial [Sporosarcina koreensis]
MMNMDTLNLLFQLAIFRDEQGRYEVTATDTSGRAVPPDRLSSFLFFNNEQALYGLLPETDDEAVYLNTNEFLQVFAGKTHPFASFEGRTTNDEAHLSALREAARLWNETDFWQHAELDAGTIRFDEEKIGISALSSMILHDAIREK